MQEYWSGYPFPSSGGSSSRNQTQVSHTAISQNKIRTREYYEEQHMQLKDAVELLKKHGKGHFGQPISPVIMKYQLLKDNKWNMPERVFIRIEKGLIKEYWVSYS